MAVRNVAQVEFHPQPTDHRRTFGADLKVSARMLSHPGQAQVSVTPETGPRTQVQSVHRRLLITSLSRLGNISSMTPPSPELKRQLRMTFV